MTYLNQPQHSHSPANIDELSRFYIANVFEELDVPRKWYLDRNEGMLYWMPPVSGQRPGGGEPREIGLVEWQGREAAVTGTLIGLTVYVSRVLKKMSGHPADRLSLSSPMNRPRAPAGAWTALG